MHAWFLKPLQFGLPQPSWKDIAAAATRKRPLGNGRSPFYDAVSETILHDRGKFYAAMDDDVEYFLFDMRRGYPDFDTVLTFITPARRREIEDEIDSLRGEIEELERELEG